MNSLEKAVASAEKRELSASLATKKAREALQKSGACSHPSTSAHTEQDDDGYGHWYTREVTTCRLCFWRKSYGIWRKPSWMESEEE